MNTHRYVKLIEYAINNKSFTKNEACSASGVCLTEFENICSELFILTTTQNIHDSEWQRWTLSPQAYFNYLQYCEFKHSVASAEQAKKNSIWAIGISAALALGSILTTVFNIKF